MSKFTYCYPSTDEKDNLTPRKPKDKEENEEGRERESGDGRKKRKEDKDSRGEQVDHQVFIIVNFIIIIIIIIIIILREEKVEHQVLDEGRHIGGRVTWCKSCQKSA